MKNKTVLTTIGVLLAGAVLGCLIFLISNQFLNKQSAAAKCETTGKSITVIIKDDAFSEKQIDGKLCDTLTIVNNDDKVRNIAFGVHDRHEAYDGVTEKVLPQGGSFSVTFNKTGTYDVHDHLEEETQATFTVTK